MGWFNEDSYQFQAYEQVTKNASGASWTLELVAAAGSYAAAKAYEEYVAKNGSLPTEEKAQEIFASASGAFIDNQTPAPSIDKEAAKQSAKKQVGDAFKKLGGIDPKKIISKEKFEKLKQTYLQQEAGYVVVEAPNEDLDIINKLLGLSGGTPDKPIVKLAEEAKSCSNCGRHYSFLDILNTGLTIHSEKFLKDIITGKYGYIFNPRDGKAGGHNCYKCGKPGDVEAAVYSWTQYFWQY